MNPKEFDEWSEGKTFPAEVVYHMCWLEDMLKDSLSLLQQVVDRPLVRSEDRIKDAEVIAFVKKTREAL